MNPILSVIEGKKLVSSVFWLIIIAVICGLLWWLIDYCKTPEPFNRVGKVIVAIVGVLFLINLLLGLGGADQQFIRW
jgi:asparagine N-glycosylation enzyme membrane subunit Stt3